MFECLFRATTQGTKYAPRCTGHVCTGIGSSDLHAGNGARAKEHVNKSFSAMQELHMNIFNWRGGSQPDSSRWNLPPNQAAANQIKWRLSRTYVDRAMIYNTESAASG